MPVTGALLALLLAGSGAIALPPWPLSPDGDLVAVSGGAPLQADRARVGEVAPGLWRVVPEEGARTVVLRSGGSSSEAAVEPPPGEIVVQVVPGAQVKGRDASAALTVTVLGPDGLPDPAAAKPLVSASTGRVLDLVPDGPGRFTGRFELPSTRWPEVAVLIALSPRCPLCETPRAIGWALVPLSAAIDLRGRSEPGARIELRVGERTFGPAFADPDGRFTLPIVVPPHVRQATSTSSDRLGNSRRREIDLHLPEVDRLGCVAWPAAIPADGRSRAQLWCVASDPAGAPVPGAGLEISAGRSAVEPFEPFRGGLQRARIRAPRGGGRGVDTVVARYPAGGSASRDETRIALVAGAPASFEVRLEREPVPVGASVAGGAFALDTWGSELGQARGSPGAQGFGEEGRFVARPTPGDWIQRAQLRFALSPGSEAATLALRRERDGWVAVARTVDARPAAGIPIRFGSGLVVTTDERGEARAHAVGDTETATAPGGLRAAGFAGAGGPPASFELRGEVEVPLRPGGRADVRARVDGRILRWRVEGAAGEALRDRRVILRAQGVDLGTPEADGDGGRCAIRSGRGTVAVVDEATGAAAVLEVP
jgi:hypothetical protein